ncbi:MAG TPA: FecR domain-containing protein [Steroidobacter sp.]|uniref:FecR family protein n=1 Tax=Steroidobacter sp. TaxID=1978227 RepID=UPI002EDB18D8
MTIPTDEDDDMNGFLHEGAHERAIKHALSNEAAEWFVRLRDDRLGLQHRERNVRWLKQSPDHIAELLRIQQVYKVLRAAKLQDRSPPGEGEPESNVIELVPRVPPPLPLPQPTRSRTRFESWKIAAVAACITLSLLLAYVVKGAWLDRTIETDLGQWRTAQLTDGTQVRVGPGSLLEIAFGDDRRTVRLIRGEAMFDVAEDGSRPFFVESEMVGVLAAGTEFRVSRRGGEDIVAVTEGSVAVYRDGRDTMSAAVAAAPVQKAEATAALSLTAGEQVSVTRSQSVAKQKVNVDYEQAWADGWLVYEGKTIAEVASEFNRRNRTKIVVAAPSIAERHLAFFRGIATDPESFVAAISRSSDITVVRGGPNELRIELSPQT